MTQSEKAHHFKALHVPGNPLVLYNIWDAGSARAVAKAGASALATGSWSVAAAQGYGDGEAIPLDLLLTIATRICANVDLPVSIDFEGAYAIAPEDVARNIRALLDTGAIGINFEDRVVQGSGLHGVEVQAARIAAMRAEAGDMPLFINARTDLFLGTDPAGHAGSVDEALARAAAYAEAGADGFFVPGLTDLTLIRQISAASPLPVNAMMMAELTLPGLAAAGVARISHGPGPYRAAMADLTARAKAL